VDYDAQALRAQRLAEMARLEAMAAELALNEEKKEAAAAAGGGGGGGGGGAGGGGGGGGGGGIGGAGAAFRANESVGVWSDGAWEGVRGLGTSRGGHASLRG